MRTDKAETRAGAPHAVGGLSLNRKIQRLIEPNIRMFLFILVLSSAVSVNFSMLISLTPFFKYMF